MPRMSNRCLLGLCNGSGQLRVARPVPDTRLIRSGRDLRQQFEDWQNAVPRVDVVECKCTLSDSDVALLLALGIQPS